MSNAKRNYEIITNFIEEADKNRTDEQILQDFNENPNQSFLNNIAEIRKISAREKARRRKELAENTLSILKAIILEFGIQHIINSYLKDKKLDGFYQVYFSKLNNLSIEDKKSIFLDRKYLDIYIQNKPLVEISSENQMLPSKGLLAARKVLEHLGIWHDPRALDIHEIALSRGVSYVKELKIDGAQGRIILNGNDAVISCNSKIRHEGKKRFVLAHELGHYELHRHSIEPIHTDNNKSLNINYKTNEIESQANEFAAELLLPTHLFSKLLEGQEFSLSAIVQIAKFMNVSNTMALLKYMSFGKTPVGVIYTDNQEVKWSSFSDNFNSGFIENGSTLPDNTAAGRYIYHKKRLPQDRQPLNVCNWFPNKENQDANKFEDGYEQCLNMGGKKVLTCLWKENLN